MTRFRAVWRNFFDVRAGEFPRTICMSLYFLSVLFAYYILKPASRALFLNKFDIDKLPYLYILIAAAGGTMAYFYTRTAVKASLQAAVNWSTGIIVVCLLGLWWLVGLGQAWVFYAFNIWVSLFPVVMVAQGWLVAANVFNSREARRLYGPIGIGAVVGAAFGGAFTAQMVRFTGTRNLILCSAFFVGVAWVWFRLVLIQKGVSLAGARGAEAHEAEFSFGEIARALRTYRHLQVITAIMTLQFIVDVTIEYQFNVMAKQTFKGDHLTAFLGNFYGPYLSILTIGLQLFLTTAIVRRLGVGGTLQIMPATVTLTSLAIYFAPSVYSTGAVRLTEAATRYTLNRTGMELLYLPLPADLKNRTKAFIDVFVDRMARGAGGMLLIVLTSVFALKVRSIALVTLAIAASWIVLAMKASREYVATVRKRIASRRLDFESLRLNVGDRALTGLLERTSLADNPRQATYALTLLAETPGYKLEPLLKKLVSGRPPEVRARVYELARVHGIPALLGPALQEISSADGQSPSVKPAVEYVLAVSPDAEALGREFVEHRNPLISSGAIEAIASHPEWAENVITPEWLAAAAAGENPQRRALAASAVASIGDRGTELLHRLLEDSDPDVVAAACRAAGALRNRAYVFALLRRLGDVRLRAVAIDALAAYGPRICGTLGDILEDPSAAPAMRRQIPRVLKKIVDQRSVDTLVRALAQQEDRPIREPVLKALNRLRESDDRLNYSESFVSEQMMEEARYYFELSAALEPFRERRSDLPATSLLSRTLEERLNQTLSRMFRLLGLRYPPREIYSAYLAVHRQRSEEVSAALEFLDNVLSRDHKRIVLPLLDAPDRVAETGQRLFGIPRRDAESAVRELMRSRDSWLAACAMATAAELKLSRLAGDIREAAGRATAEVAQVARSAEAALA